MGLDIRIDRFTPCLIERKTGQIVDTTYAVSTVSDRKALQSQGWLFNWMDSDLAQSDVYQLMVTGEASPQGLVAVSDYPDSLALYVNLAESAPWNKGPSGRFEGVGGHLFAIAVQLSKEKGYGGFLFLDAKNMELVEYYSKLLGARHIGGVHPYRMVVSEDAAEKLIETYTLKGGR